MKKPPVSDVIVTKRLPERCPACYRDGLKIDGPKELPSAGTPLIYRLTCEGRSHGCNWTAKYELQDAHV